MEQMDVGDVVISLGAKTIYSSESQSTHLFPATAGPSSLKELQMSCMYILTEGLTGASS